jgi:hypothetical protein
MLKPAKYFIVWIEGIEPKGGEKIKHFRKDGSIEYTLDMMDAMRVKSKDIPNVKSKMETAGVANWVLEGNTFIRTSYAPKGTIYGTEAYYKQIKK